MRTKLQFFAEGRRLDAQWADAVRAVAAPSSTTDPVRLLGGQVARHRAALSKTEMDALSFSDTHVFRDPFYTRRRARALLHGLRNREIRLVQRALVHDRRTWDAVGPIYHAADSLTEALCDAVQDFTARAQYEMAREGVSFVWPTRKSRET